VPAPTAPPLPARPVLRAGIEPRLTEDDRLFLLRELGDDDLCVPDHGPWVAAVLELCDGHRTVDEVRAAVDARGLDPAPEGVAGALAMLVDAGVVVDGAPYEALAPATAERLDRQLAYFGQDLDPVDVVRAQDRLRDATVCLIGVGGLGSWCAYALACCGLGRLVLVDGDRLERSNLNRQILYREADVGRPKAELAARALAAYDPGLDVVAVDRRLESGADVAAVVEGADLVVDAADWPPHLIDRWVNEACWAAGIPYLTMSQQPPLIRVGPLYVPGRTGCYTCRERSWREEFPLFDDLARARRPFATAATFGPACGAVGALAASEAIHFLIGAEPATVGAALLLDTRGFALSREEVPRWEACPVCAPVPALA
jgi:bacteriocin biosynthesis cyclodehydratase domain-containing protein